MTEENEFDEQLEIMANLKKINPMKVKYGFSRKNSVKILGNDASISKIK